MDTLVGQNFQSADDVSDWWVTLYFVETSSNGAHVYQVNVYDENSTLVDDGALIFVNADGTAALESGVSSRCGVFQAVGTEFPLPFYSCSTNFRRT